MGTRTVTVKVEGETHRVLLKKVSDVEYELTIRDRARVTLFKPDKYKWRKKGKGAYMYNYVIAEVIKMLEEEERNS